MGRSCRPGIVARGVFGIVAAVVDECSVSKAVMHKSQLSAMDGRATCALEFLIVALSSESSRRSIHEVGAVW